MALYGAIEAGGTKFVLAVGEDPAQPREVVRIPTSNNPSETLGEVIRYFTRQRGLAGLGVASFGPLDFKDGTITNTPKLAWQGFPLRDTLQKALGLAVALETDVNAAALGEARCGAGRGVEDLVYITVGTGIGGGVLSGGKLVHGRMHSEIGHLLVGRARDEDEQFEGVCPFHGDCLEGLASGPAMEQRWGEPADGLPEGHLAWLLEAEYLGRACVNLACVLSPRMIVLGGGVMTQGHLLPLIRRRVSELANGYLPLPDIVAPGCEYPALSGALALAMEAAA